MATAQFRLSRWSAVVTPLLVLTLLLTPAELWTQVAPAARSDARAVSGLDAEAQAFMVDYADDLRRGDASAVAARYDPAGAYELRAGLSMLTTHEALTARYATDWQPPARFEWRDLAYEVVSPEAVVVSGTFAWYRARDAAPGIQSYVALLRRPSAGSGLKIRLEAEAGRPPIPWLLLGIGAVVLVALGLGAGWLIGRRGARPVVGSAGGLTPVR